MKTFLDCYPCFVRQALDAARMVGADEAQQKAVLDRVLDALGHIEPSSTPPEMGDQSHRIVRQETGNGDPYRSAKEISTRQALAFYPRLKALLAEADDPLEVAVRLSIAKGQANYETLSEEGARVFLLLQAKCPVIAHDVGVPVGSIVLRQGEMQVGKKQSTPPAT